MREMSGRYIDTQIRIREVPLNSNPTPRPTTSSGRSSREVVFVLYLCHLTFSSSIVFVVPLLALMVLWRVFRIL